MKVFAPVKKENKMAVKSVAKKINTTQVQ